MHCLYVLCLLVAAASAASLRPRRDVSELPASTYLAPSEQEQSKLSGQQQQGSGYVYRTVRQRRYKLRERRDVSHLPLEYLPPVVLPPLPSRDYLPPVEQHAASLKSVIAPSRDYLPPVEPLTVKLNNEYLPPAPVVEEIIETTEALPETTTTEAPTTTTTTTTELTTTTEVVTEKQPETELEPEPEPELKTHEHLESGALEADGYHYRTPDVIPDLSPVQEIEELPSREYLPPLDDNAVVAEGPEDNESAALKDDGYQYRRIIKRLRY